MDENISWIDDIIKEHQKRILHFFNFINRIK